ncbi:MAG: hypothetical protein LBB28_01165 [Synergistaceae bacterium]|jgi:hypothetical protein|nr:hypothetical protein [Synergistaceae bacterium]
MRVAGGVGLFAILPGVFMALAASVWWSSLELTADEMTPAVSERKMSGSPDALAASSSDPWSGYFIYLPKNEYLPAEIITANISSVPSDMLNDNASVVIRGIGAPNGEFISRELVYKRDSSVRMRAPLNPGDYEMVGYDNGTILNEAAAVVRAPFSVAAISDGAYSVTLDKSSYHPSEQMSVFASGVPRDMIKDNAMVGIFKRGATSKEYMLYEYIKRKDEKITMHAPFEPGDYELRGFSNGFALSEFTMTAMVPFKVEGSALGVYNAVPAKQDYAPGEEMTVSVNGVPKYMLDDGAILGISERDAKPGEFVAYKYIVAGRGSYAFDAPSSAGEYEIRGYTNKYFLADSTLASRNVFRVID